jgi:hypothetical protein
VLENKKELEDLKAKLEAILSIVKRYQEHHIESALSNRIELFSTSVALSRSFFVMFVFINVLQRYHQTFGVDQEHGEAFIADPCSRGYEGC